MSSHDFFSVSGSSPTSKKKRLPLSKADFRLEHHGSICLLVPLGAAGREWVEEHIGEGNGFQPYWKPSRIVVIEPRYLADLLGDIQKHDLVVR